MGSKIVRTNDVSFSEAQIPSARAVLFAGRREKKIGRAVGISQFGVNYLELDPGAMSSLRHWHEGEDEFVYVLSGEVVLIDEHGEHRLAEGSAAGFPAGVQNAHHLQNRSNGPARMLVVGTRKRGTEVVHYPDDPEIAEATIERGANGDRIERR